MRIVIAPNAFKESLTAWQAAKAIEAGLKKAIPHAECIVSPMADGGDGTAEALARATGGRIVHTRVLDPLGNPLRTTYALLYSDTMAVIELAAAAGLRLLETHERNPLETSTFGVGLLIQKALDRRIRDIYIGVGGSATVDGGIGLAYCLGYQFPGANGEFHRAIGANLSRMQSIRSDDYRKMLNKLGYTPRFTVLCDVTNRLLGPQGAARVFGPQKGASPRQVEMLESGLSHLAVLIKKELDFDVTRLRGGGAAGGAAAGLAAFLGAKIQKGAEKIAEITGLEDKIRSADWVITGEGCLDAQTAFGKAPAVVARIAARHGVPVIGIAGSIGPGAASLRRFGFTSLLSICDRPMPLLDAMDDAENLLVRLGRSLGAILNARTRKTK